MRALTVHQPWADLIMAGLKDVENRTWPVPSTLPQWHRCNGCDLRRPSGWNWIGHHGLDTPRPWVTNPAHCDDDHRARPDGPFPFRLGIHAAKKPEGYEIYRELRQRFGVEVLEVLGQHQGGYGILLGFVTVTGCHNDLDDDDGELEALAVPCEENDGGPHCDHWVYDFDPCCRCGHHATCSRWAEFDGGGIWHWTLTDPKPLDEPIPLRGYQRLWTIPDDVLTTIGAPS